MSTTIDVYPANDSMPLVEATRARTQELFQDLLGRRRVGSTVEVKAFYPSAEEPIRYVDRDLRWMKDLHLGFGYWINGEWDSSSWPSCLERDGEWDIAEDLVGVVSAETLAKVLGSDHYWCEDRNAGGPAVASTGYGLVAAALAEATDGVIASWDSAFDSEHNGETAERFLAWWGDRQIDFYGEERFRAARAAR